MLGESTRVPELKIQSGRLLDNLLKHQGVEFPPIEDRWRAVKKNKHKECTGLLRRDNTCKGVAFSSNALGVIYQHAVRKEPGGLIGYITARVKSGELFEVDGDMQLMSGLLGSASLVIFLAT
ncbi:Protein of unknown function [Cotesia congregata]|uniref:Uncharacterized protein n=1 Tax=Cotesia congregata TaxID=51543 RepID=A0A8J2MX32_COTCN|nr:Protein of unknown function [Cotesia congregata]